MCIVTGPRIDLAIDLIDRMKRLFYDKGLVFDNKETVIELLLSLSYVSTTTASTTGANTSSLNTNTTSPSSASSKSSEE
jgi:hypothetical protein